MGINILNQCPTLQSDYITLRRLGDAHMQADELDLAFKFLILSTSLQPNGFAWGSLGQLHERRGNIPEALKCFERALKAMGSSQQGIYTLINIGDIYHNHLNDFPKALDYFKQVIEMSKAVHGGTSKETVQAYQNTAGLCISRGHPHDAKELLVALLNLLSDPNMPKTATP